MRPGTCQAGVASGTRAAQTGQPAGQCDTQETPPGPARPGHRFRPSHDHPICQLHFPLTGVHAGRDDLPASV